MAEGTSYQTGSKDWEKAKAWLSQKKVIPMSAKVRLKKEFNSN